MDLIKIIHDTFSQLTDGEKKPLNILEVSNLWFFLTITEQSIRSEEHAYNIAQDEELKKILKDAKVSVHDPIAKEISELLLKENVPLPRSTPMKPVADYREIPNGAKLSDEEIANLMSFNLLLGVNYASRGLTESIRVDVGGLFFKIIARKTVLGNSLKQLMEKRGWLRIPPKYNP